jgi:hypothetical protein
MLVIAKNLNRCNHAKLRDLRVIMQEELVFFAT